MTALILCTAPDCKSAHDSPASADTPEKVYADLAQHGWNPAPACCPLHWPSDIYDRMNDAERRAVVDWVYQQGRHLEDLEDWQNEDNYLTTEGTAEVYQKFILPHEDEGATCTCGNTRHPDKTEE